MTDSQSLLAGVGKTALGVAHVRDVESRREDRLFDDPCAQAFVEAAPGAFTEEPTSVEERASLGPLASLGAAFYHHAVLRTRFFDDYLLGSAAKGCSQVVLLAAGLDARAFRLDWPEGVRLFEVDLPEVLAFKRRVLDERGATPRCERAAIPSDLRGDWRGALIRAGFKPAEPTAWLAEGLLIYLSGEEVARLLTTVGNLSAPKSRISFEQDEPGGGAFAERVRSSRAMDRYTALWKGGLGPETPDWLARHGWQTRTYPRDEAAASYGRPEPEPPGGGFLTAVRSR